MTPKEKQAIRDVVWADRVTFKKDGTVEFKQGYFYRSGNSSDKVAAGIVKALTAAGYSVTNVQDEDKWAAWPKTSYFVATMKVTKPEVCERCGILITASGHLCGSCGRNV